MAAEDTKDDQIGSTQATAAAAATTTCTNTCTCAAVCYLDNRSELEQPSTPQERPEVKVIHDRTYSLQRYLNSQSSSSSPHDHNLRPSLAFRAQMTEMQSRERMATVIVALVEKLPKSKA
ncbi:hypothetical protein PG993_007328 [Apiospora rasikravindrae]|uniref:Uncharacterized protein n=1 Tax=Apiospora rasikravindrae TaxID=990691 RepID=A0ABR1SXK0_9PEZI